MSPSPAGSTRMRLGRPGSGSAKRGGQGKGSGHDRAARHPLARGLGAVRVTPGTSAAQPGAVTGSGSETAAPGFRRGGGVGSFIAPRHENPGPVLWNAGSGGACPRRTGATERSRGSSCVDPPGQGTACSPGFRPRRGRAGLTAWILVPGLRGRGRRKFRRAKPGIRFLGRSRMRHRPLRPRNWRAGAAIGGVVRSDPGSMIPPRGASPTRRRSRPGAMTAGFRPAVGDEALPARRD